MQYCEIGDLIGKIGSFGFMARSCRGWLSEDPQTWEKIGFPFRSSPIFRIIVGGGFFCTTYIFIKALYHTKQGKGNMQSNVQVDDL